MYFALYGKLFTYEKYPFFRLSYVKLAITEKFLYSRHLQPDR